MSETSLRTAVPDDVDEIVELGHALAVYEKEPDAPMDGWDVYRLTGAALESFGS